MVLATLTQPCQCARIGWTHLGPKLDFRQLNKDQAEASSRAADDDSPAAIQGSVARKVATKAARLTCPAVISSLGDAGDIVDPLAAS